MSMDQNKLLSFTIFSGFSDEVRLNKGSDPAFRQTKLDVM